MLKGYLGPYMVDSLSILKTLHHLLLQFRVGNLGAYGDTALYGLLNLSDEWHQLGWGVDVLRGHSTLSGVQG